MNQPDVNFTTISFDNMLGEVPDMAIRNFFVSGGESYFPELSLSHPYIVDGIVFIICTKGEGRISLNLKEYTLRENSVMCILPGFIIETSGYEEDFCIEYLFFSLDFFSDLRMFPNAELPYVIKQDPCLELNSTQFSVLLEYHSLILKRYLEKELLYHNKIIRNLLRALLYEIICLYEYSRKEGKVTTSRSDEIFYLFSQLLAQNYRHERSVAFYANKLFITPKYLTKVTKSVIGRNALDLISEMTILHIQALLRSSNLTVLQISEELNFSSPSFFGRFFKKHTGMTPVEYRASK